MYYRITYAISNNFFKEEMEVDAQNEIEAFATFFKIIRENTYLNINDIWDIQAERL